MPTCSADLKNNKTAKKIDNGKKKANSSIQELVAYVIYQLIIGIGVGDHKAYLGQ